MKRAALSTEEIEAFMSHFREFISKFDTQKEVAEELGVTQQQVSRISAGATFGLPFLRAVERATGLTLREMVLKHKGVPVAPAAPANDAPVRTYDLTPRYDNLRLAVEKAERAGKPWPASVVAHAKERMALWSNEDLRIGQWEEILANLMKNGDDVLARAAAKFGVAPVDDDLKPEDIEPPSDDTGTTGLRRKPEIGHSTTRAKK